MYSIDRRSTPLRHRFAFLLVLATCFWGAADSRAQTINVPASLNLGSISVASSANTTLTITNVGALSLTVSSITTDDGQFTVSPTSAVIAALGGSANFTVTFAPTAAGAQTATLSIAHNDLITTSPTTLSLSGTGLNDAPVADAKSPTTSEDTPVNISLTGSDSNGDAISFQIDSAPSNGTASISGTTATYTPNSNFNGADSFTVKASDGTVLSAAATIAVTVTAVNDAPTLSALSNVTISEDASTQNVALSFAAGGGSDESGQTVTVTATSSNTGLIPTPSISGSTLSYTPVANANGSATITVTAHDGTSSVQQSFTVTVTAVNDAPTADPKAASIGANPSVAVALTGSDIDGDALSFQVDSSPSNGSVSISGSTATYTPNGGFSGSDSFTIKANDGVATSAAVTISVSITAVNVAPSASAQSISTNKNQAVSTTLSGSDANNDALSFQVASSPSNGSVTISGSTATYTPNSNFSGTDSFTFKANDGTALSVAATVSITVNNINVAPSVSAQSISTNENQAVSITLGGSDADNDALSFQVDSSPSNGSVTISGSTATYTPNSNFSGTDSFTFKASDGTALSATATVSITVNATTSNSVNSAPSASAQSISTNQNQAVSITLSGSDADNDALSFQIASSPSNGSVSISGSTATYTPNANFSGSDSFTYNASDGTALSAAAAVSITVNSAAGGNDESPSTPSSNTAPTAQDQIVRLDEDGVIVFNLSGSDSDTNPAALFYDMASVPKNGTVALDGNQATYTPNANFSGSDSFTFIIDDGQVSSNEGTVSITVAAINDPPVLSALEEMIVREGEELRFSLSALDVDRDVLNFSVESVPQGAFLSDTTFVWKPSYGQAGQYRPVFIVRDSQNSTHSRTATIVVEATLPPPGTVQPELLPAALSFGSVPLADETVRTLTIVNPLSLPMEIAAFSFDSPVFSLVNPSEPLTIAAGDSATIGVRFSPSAGVVSEERASLTIDSNLGPVQVPISGMGVWAGLSVDVEELDFASVAASLTRTVDLVLTNPGNLPLRIDAITSSNKLFSTQLKKLTIAAGGKRALSIRFAPQQEGVETGILTIKSDAALEVEISLLGLGLPKPCLRGDFDCSGEIDLDDFLQLASVFNPQVPAAEDKYDLDGDGVVYFGDFFLFSDLFEDRGQVGKLMVLAQDLLPTTIELVGNYPNPFNSETTIEYLLPLGEQVELSIYNSLGQRVRSLVDERQTAGRWRRSWDGRDDRGMAVSSGVYFYRLQTSQFAETRQLLLIK